MIGEGDVVHAARLRNAVDVGRARVAVAAPEEAHVAADRRMARVNVEVGAAERHRIGFSSRIWNTVDPSGPKRSGSILFPKSARRIVLCGARTLIATPNPVIGSHRPWPGSSRPHARSRYRSKRYCSKMFSE